MGRIRGSEPPPESGERVIETPAKSRYLRPPKPRTHGETQAVRRATAHRRSWEQSPEGVARTTGIDTSRGANMAQTYHINNYGLPEEPGPRVYDRQLPGMADPHAAPRPPRWEELTDTQREHTERRLREFGTSVDRITSDLGAQIDQAHMRAWRHGEAALYASDFYSSGEPRRRIDESARDLGIPQTIHAQMNAMTSPNTKFSIRRRDGSTTFPNDEAAIHAVRWAQSGRPAEALTNDLTSTRTGTGRAQGYETNMRKAASAMTQFLHGTEPADWRFQPNNSDAFSGSPKTGPYANSWNDTHPQFTVSDVHTGGGGAFPHLSYEKQRTEPDGTVTKFKSQREVAVASVPYSHSAIDYAMRQAMGQRNLGSVRRTQATQWGEEQLQRGEAGLRGAPDEAIAYPPPAARREIPGQQSMLDTHNQPRWQAVSPAHDHRSPTAKKYGLDF